MANPDDERPSLRFDEDVPTLKRKTGQGAAVVIVTQGLRTAMTFVSAVILARLLTPADFGLIAMAAPVYVLAIQMSSMGIGQAVIQRPTITHNELSNLYWWSLGIFSTSGLVIAASAPLVAAFYGVDDITNIILVYSVLMVINGACAIHGSVLMRRLRFFQQGAIAITSQVVTMTVGIGLAFYLRSYWALLAMEFAGALCRLVMIWKLSGWSPSRFDRQTKITGLLKFGANVAITRILTFATDNIAAVLIGKVWGQVALGFYDRAYKLMLAPTGRTTGAIAPAAQAILSRLAVNDARYRRAFLSLNRLALLTIGPGVLWTVVHAPLLVPLLLGEGWDEVVPIFQALGVLAVVRIMVVMFNWMFIAEGRDRELRQWGIFRAVVIIAAVSVGIRWGAFGVAAAYAGVVTGFLTPIHMIWVTRRSPVTLGDLIGTVFVFAPGLAMSSLVLFWLLDSAQLGTALTLALGLAASYAIVWATVMIQPAGRDAVRHGLDVARSAFSRSQPDLSEDTTSSTLS